MIFLYRAPLLHYWCETGEPLEDIVRNTLIHEIGHHFGYSDDDMDAIEFGEDGRGADPQRIRALTRDRPSGMRTG